MIFSHLGAAEKKNPYMLSPLSRYGEVVSFLRTNLLEIILGNISRFIKLLFGIAYIEKVHKNRWLETCLMINDGLHWSNSYFLSCFGQAQDVCKTS